jgi:hypothetical protein
LTAFFGTDAGIRARRIDKRDHGQIEPVGHFHQPDGFAITLGHGHAEVVLDAAFDVSTLFVAEHEHRAAAEFTDTADDSFVVGEVTVPGERCEIFDQRADELEAMRPLVLLHSFEFSNLLFEFENRFLKLEIGVQNRCSGHGQRPFAGQSQPSGGG